MQHKLAVRHFETHISKQISIQRTILEIPGRCDFNDFSQLIGIAAILAIVHKELDTQDSIDRHD